MWIVCITSVRHVLTVNGYGGRQTKENEKSWCFKGWETLDDYYNTLDFAVEKGMKKGMEEGMEKGLQKGKAEGKAEGRQEEKHSIALNLKKLGVSIEQIAFATGLSIEEIEKL